MEIETEINNYFCTKFKEARLLLSGENTIDVAEKLEYTTTDL
jgi:hypothetical protein